MKAESKIVKIKNQGSVSTNYIDKELTKRNINPLRWAIVGVSDTIVTVSVANLKK